MTRSAATQSRWQRFRRRGEAAIAGQFEQSRRRFLDEEPLLFAERFLAEYRPRMALSKRLRLRRVGKLCCGYLQNHAYYTAGYGSTAHDRQGPFWDRSINNSFDLCVLEFCKLFTDGKGAYHWRKIVTDQDAFLTGLLAATGMTSVEWDEYAETFRFYRNKYLAHLTDETGGNFPHLKAGKEAVAYLYDYLLKYEDEGDFFLDASATADDFYADRKEEAEAVYS